MNIASSFSVIFSSFIALFGHLFSFVFKIFVGALVAFLVSFCFSCKCIPFFKTVEQLKKRNYQSEYRWFSLFYWLLVDFKNRKIEYLKFNRTGFHFFVGRQGAGKTIAMVNELNEIKKRYPNCLIVTNFKYEYADFIMTDWLDFLNIRNGEDGVVFAIDEIHSEYSASDWKDIPDNMLQEISQQRKQKICILASAQFFTRVAKPLREQAETVTICRNFAKRLIFQLTYDALEYSSLIDNPLVVSRKLKPLYKKSFVATDDLRGCYDTYEKINRMRDKQMKVYKQSQTAGV